MNRYIFFTGTYFVFRSSFSGSEEKHLSTIVASSKVSIDYLNKKLYLMDMFYSCSIMSMDYYGNNRQFITTCNVEGGVDKGSATTFRNMLYWRIKNRHITEINITTGVINRNISITTKRNSVYEIHGLVVVEKSQQPTGEIDIFTLTML